eukprot:TRINITY_DN68836_c0_g1_i1.p1 TRINITY_DN68836_c0_g1~~TRINITY_DN68836_c0_g1_i1.p1  ORF type:complete len:426 (+),score=120.79 TRINITY_DN68836_c0_g1_i1:19-1296(+)
MAGARLVILLAAALAAPGACEANLTKLREDIEEEERRTRIADFVADSAIQNESLQAQKSLQAEKDITELKARYHAAGQTIEQAKQQVQELEAKVEASKQRLNASEEERRASLDAAKRAESKKEMAEAKTEEERYKADGILPERDTVIFDGLHLFCKWLSHLPGQSAIAAAAGLLGMASLWSSQLFLEVVSVTLVALGAGMAAAAQLNTTFADEMANKLTFLTGAEVALLTAAAVVIGFDGFQLVIGAALGLSIANLSEVWVASWCNQVALWYLVLFALGALAAGLGRRHASAVLGAAAGGLMVASSVIFLLGTFLADGELPGSWVEYVRALTACGNKQPFGEDMELLRFVGFLVWAVYALLGVSRWFLGRPVLWGEQEIGGDLRSPLLANDDGSEVPNQEVAKVHAAAEGQSILKSQLERYLRLK